MKYLKLILSLTIGISLMSCSDDDSPNNPDEEVTELLIGIWQPLLTLDSNETFIYDDCGKQGRLVFNSNGNFSLTGYEENNENECVEFTNSIGTWKNVSFEMYELTQNNNSGTIRISFIGTDKMRTYEAEEDYTEYQRTE